MPDRRPWKSIEAALGVAGIEDDSGVNRLRFHPDDVADSLWEGDRPGFNVNLDYLPLHDDTRKALRSWSERWALLLDRSIWAQAVEDGMATGTSDPVSREEWDLAEREGRELFERVKADLGPDWSVEWDVTVPD
jgi:hypothetical protein